MVLLLLLCIGSGKGCSGLLKRENTSKKEAGNTILAFYANGLKVRKYKRWIMYKIVGELDYLFHRYLSKHERLIDSVMLNEMEYVGGMVGVVSYDPICMKIAETGDMIFLKHLDVYEKWCMT